MDRTPEFLLLHLSRDLNVSGSFIASRAGVDPSTLYKALGGNATLGLKTLLKICKVNFRRGNIEVNIRMDYLLGGQISAEHAYQYRKEIYKLTIKPLDK